MERRKFLNTASRWFLLGGIITGSGFLVKRQQISLQQTCSLSPVCSKCNRYESCEQVQASGNGKEGRK